MNKKGFTLVELIIVIAIIGILAAVLIPSISGYITKARRSNDVQLAGAMSNEIQNYCAENDIIQNKLLGTDVRTILLYRGFDLKPRKGNWTFVYNIENNKVEVVDIGNDGVFAALNYTPFDPTHIHQNYFLIGKGNSSIEKAVEKICNLTTLNDYNSAVAMVAGTDYEQVFSVFNPTNTLYILSGGTLAPSGNITQVVCVELITHLPKLGSITIPDVRLPQTLRTSEVSNPNFPNAKVVDLSKVNKIDLKQLGFDYKDGEGSYFYKFQLGKYVVDSKLQVFSDEIISILKIKDNTSDYAIKRKFTISYYNENGLYATGSIIYAQNQEIILNQ